METAMSTTKQTRPTPIVLFGIVHPPWIFLFETHELPKPIVIVHHDSGEGHASPFSE
jgi:hypothetical protein